MNNNGWDIRSRGRSFRYAWQGVRYLLRQPNACIHLCVALIVIVCGALLHLSAVEWCLVSLCIGGVLMAEGFNTAVEAIADKVSPGFDPLIGHAKDVAAGAVLIFVVAAVAVGIIIFLPKCYALI